MLRENVEDERRTVEDFDFLAETFFQFALVARREFVIKNDNLRVGRHDGIASVIDTLMGHPLFGHVTLTRAERSPVAALVTQVLDSAGLA